MLKYGSSNTADLSVMKIRYWDNSILLVNCGYPVAVKCPTGTSYDWLTMKKEGVHKFVYINLSMCILGQLDSDLLLNRVSQSDLEDTSVSTPDDLAK